MLKSGGRAVVVHEWAPTLARRLVEAPNWARLRWQRLGDRRRGGSGHDEEQQRVQSGSYIRPHCARWFTSRPWPFRPRLAGWRIPSAFAVRSYIHPWLGGRWLLRALFAAETRWGGRLGRYAAYPLILIDKAPGGPQGQ